MEESWVCRDYRKGDEGQILGLFRRVYGKELNPFFWKLRFINNPFGKGIIKLLFEGKDLIGHYAVAPMTLEIRDSLLQAAVSMTTMTHPDYTGKGVFTSLAEEAYKTCEEKGISLVYGFPNQNSYPIFLSRLAWNGMGRMTILEKTMVPPILGSKMSNRFSIKEIQGFDDRFDLLWNRIKPYDKVIVPRTRQFLAWRFARNTGVDYNIYTISHDIDDLLGYVILKIYTWGTDRIGHIVDMMSINDNDVAGCLINHSCVSFGRVGINHISCWVPEGSLFENLLKKDGFTRKETGTGFGVRVFNKCLDNAKNFEQMNNWALTMADSDTY